MQKKCEIIFLCDGRHDDIVKHLRIIECCRSDYKLLRIRYWQSVFNWRSMLQAKRQHNFFHSTREKKTWIIYNRFACTPKIRFHHSFEIIRMHIFLIHFYLSFFQYHDWWEAQLVVPWVMWAIWEVWPLAVWQTRNRCNFHYRNDGNDVCCSLSIRLVTSMIIPTDLYISTIIESISRCCSVSFLLPLALAASGFDYVHVDIMNEIVRYVVMIACAATTNYNTYLKRIWRLKIQTIHWMKWFLSVWWSN